MTLIPWLFTILSIAHRAVSLCSVYVVPSPMRTTESVGTLQNPFSSIDHARNYLRNTSCSSFRRVVLYPTYYFLRDGSLMFDKRDHWSIYTSMTNDEQRLISADRKKNLIRSDLPVISGGILLQDWTRDQGVSMSTLKHVLLPLNH